MSGATAGVKAKRRVWADGFVSQGRDVVGNVFLSGLTPDATIEPMVTRYFPDATYTRVDAPAITALPAIDPGGTLVIQGQKGFGKSKAIRLLKSETFAGQSIVHVNFSRSLSHFSATQRGKDVHHYASDDKPLTAPLLEVVVNSLGRVRRVYDVVILDEVVSIMSSLSGALIKDTHRVKVVVALKRLLAGAKYVVLADAMIEPVTVQFVRLLRGGYVTPLRFLDYTFRPQDGHVAAVYRSEDAWKAALIVAIGSGKKVVVPCMMAYMVKALRRQVAAAFPGLAIQAYYDGAGSNDTAKAMKRINVWAKADVLIYSPVITAGCSFEAKHFDTQFFYGVSSPFTGSVQSAIQMTSRVRDIADRDIHVYIRDSHWGPKETHPLTLPTCHPASDVDVLHAAIKCLRAFHRASSTSKVAGFAHEFCAHKVSAGFRVVFPQRDGAPTLDANYITTLGAPLDPPPVPPSKAAALAFQESHPLDLLNLSDLEHRLPITSLHDIVGRDVEEAAMDFSAIFDGDGRLDSDAYETWAVLMLLFFVRSYWPINPVVAFQASKARFATPDAGARFAECVGAYTCTARQRSRFTGSLADVVWAITVATVAERRGRPVSEAALRTRCPFNKRVALAMVRQMGGLVLTVLRERRDAGWHAVVMPNLPVSADMTPHFIVEYSRAGDGSDGQDYDKHTVLCMVVLEDPNSHQVKDDFLKLYCQAAFLATSTPHVATHLEVFHLVSSQSWNLPFPVATPDCRAVVSLVNGAKVGGAGAAADLASHVWAHAFVLDVTYDVGVLSATWNGDPVATIAALRAKLLGVPPSDYVIGFGFWDAVQEVFEGDDAVLKACLRFYDLALMARAVLGDPEWGAAIHDKRRMMGLGEHPCDSFADFRDVFVDVKRSKGFTYVLDGGSVVTKKCGDVLNVGDALRLCESKSLD